MWCILCLLGASDLALTDIEMTHEMGTRNIVTDAAKCLAFRETDTSRGAFTDQLTEARITAVLSNVDAIKTRARNVLGLRLGRRCHALWRGPGQWRCARHRGSSPDKHRDRCSSEQYTNNARSNVIEKSPILIAIIGVVVLLTGSLNGGTAKALHQPCSNSMVMVTLSQPEDCETACTAVIDALFFLETNGFRLPGLIHVDPMGRITEGVLGDAFGYFDSQTGRIHVQNFSTSQEVVQGLGIFGLPMNRDLYRSIVAHEAAHLIADHNFTMESPSPAAQEYIAYVTQLATMPPGLRDRILTNFPGEGFRTSTQINSLVYMFSPEKFAVGAYRHFVRAENGAVFFRRLVTGEIRLDPGLMP